MCENCKIKPRCRDRFLNAVQYQILLNLQITSIDQSGNAQSLEGAAFEFSHKILPASCNNDGVVYPSNEFVNKILVDSFIVNNRERHSKSEDNSSAFLNSNFSYFTGYICDDKPF